MQTVITTNAYAANTDADADAFPAAETATAMPQMQSAARRILKTLARKGDMIGVVALMGSSAVYAASQLMTLAR